MIIKPLICLGTLCFFTATVAAEDPKVSEAIRGLTSDDDDVQSKSIAYLKDHYTEAKPAMLAAFDKSDEVSYRVIDTFEAVGERAIPDLIAAFKGAGSWRKCNLALALSRFGEKAKAALPILHSELDAADPRVRYGVIAALGSIDGPRSVPILAKHLSDKDKGVRMSAIGSLASIGYLPDPTTLETMQAFAAEIIQFVKNEREDEQDLKNAAEGMISPYNRCIESAKYCLGRIGRRAVPLLDKEIVNRNNPTRQRIYFLDAIVPMANWAEKGDAVLAIPTLRKAIEDPDAEVRWSALGSLMIVCATGKSKIDPDKDLDWLFKPEAIKKMSFAERLQVASCAAEFKKYRGLAVTLTDEGLRSPDKSIIRQAIGGVPELDDGRGAVAPALIALMQHADAEIRRAAIERINGDLRFIAALPILEDVVKNDKDKWCRREAAKKIEIIREGIAQIPILQLPGN